MTWLNVIVVTSKLLVFSINGGAVTKAGPWGTRGHCVWIIWNPIRFTGKPILQRPCPWRPDRVSGAGLFVGPPPALENDST